jgi:hypothetical protein
MIKDEKLLTGYRCNNCQRELELYSERWKSLDVYDFDLCPKCYQELSSRKKDNKIETNKSEEEDEKEKEEEEEEEEGEDQEEFEKRIKLGFKKSFFTKVNNFFLLFFFLNLICF